MKLLILNGPNLNLLGTREPSIYGSLTLMDLESGLRRFAQTLGIEIECQQSNQEGHLIDALHRARNRFQGVVFNPGGYSHTSVSLRDAVAAIPIPVIEVHISNIHGREDFRRQTLTGGACAGVISGLGFGGYELAMTALVHLTRQMGIVPHAPAAASERPERPIERPSDRPERQVERLSDRPSDHSIDRPGDRPSGAAPPPAVAAGESREMREAREEREGKRRRRGRRGGRGRRREERPGDAPREEGAEGSTGTSPGSSPASSSETRHEPVDITARYANLKGAVVRRGLDVLAEDDASDEPEPQLGGTVTFVDQPESEEKPVTRLYSHDSEPLTIRAGAAGSGRETSEGPPHAEAEAHAPESASGDAGAEGEAEGKPAAKKAPRRRSSSGTGGRRGGGGGAPRGRSGPKPGGKKEGNK